MWACLYLAEGVGVVIGLRTCPLFGFHGYCHCHDHDIGDRCSRGGFIFGALIVASLVLPHHPVSSFIAPFALSMAFSTLVNIVTINRLQPRCLFGTYFWVFPSPSNHIAQCIITQLVEYWTWVHVRADFEWMLVAAVASVDRAKVNKKRSSKVRCFNSVTHPELLSLLLTRPHHSSSSSPSISMSSFELLFLLTRPRRSSHSSPSNGMSSLSSHTMALSVFMSSLLGLPSPSLLLPPSDRAVKPLQSLGLWTRHFRCISRRSRENTNVTPCSGVA